MSAFALRLIRWQKKHGRHDLPWQRDWQRLGDPYRVWLAEIMLQQTQVATVIPYYESFLARFPSLDSLAASPAAEVMTRWSGLGYYARARNLHRCAQTLAAQQGGRFPADPAAIAALPGIGPSTANAIAAVCFGARVPILDGNVKRVLCRCFCIEGFPGKPAVERELWRLAASLLPDDEISIYHQAQMDLGATICTRGKPRCALCPLADDCLAQRQGRTAELPTARPGRLLPEKQVTLLILRQGDRVLLEERPPTGVWGGLWSLPELPAGREPEEFLLSLGLDADGISALPARRHGFTHFRLEMRPLLCEVHAHPAVAEAGRRWLRADELSDAPLPSPIRKLLAAFFD